MILGVRARLDSIRTDIDAVDSLIMTDRWT